MDAGRDIYHKLRPAAPTPADELCACIGSPPVKLMYALGDNPLHCLDCNLEVPPERLALTVDLVEAVADWRSMYGAVYLLWLDSGPYEAWAYEELADVSSAANRRGLAVRAALDPIRRCYYRYFQDQTGEHGDPRRDCPSCGARLAPYPRGIFAQLLCERCSIVTVDEEG